MNALALATDAERCVALYQSMGRDDACQSCESRTAVLVARFADNCRILLCDACAELVEVDA